MVIKKYEYLYNYILNDVFIVDFKNRLCYDLLF